MRYFGALSHGNASINCCAVHIARRAYGPKTSFLAGAMLMQIGNCALFLRRAPHLDLGPPAQPTAPGRLAMVETFTSSRRFQVYLLARGMLVCSMILGVFLPVFARRALGYTDQKAIR